MQIVTAHNGVLRTVRSGGLRGERAGGGPAAGETTGTQVGTVADLVANDTDAPDGTLTASPPANAFRTGLPALDALAPGGAFALGAVHEVLFPPAGPPPRSFALLLAIAAARARGNGHVAWSDPGGTLYPPAVARAGLPMDRLLILRPASPADEAWAAAECLRCPGIAATVVEPGRLTRVQVRRLQLAAEAGGGAGVFVRPRRSADQYAAVTRWLVCPAKGERAVQRWSVQLVHGHGGQVDGSVILEVSRDVVRTQDGATVATPAAHPVRATAPVADRPPPAGRAAG